MNIATMANLLLKEDTDKQSIGKCDLVTLRVCSTKIPDGKYDRLCTISNMGDRSMQVEFGLLKSQYQMYRSASELSSIQINPTLRGIFNVVFKLSLHPFSG